MFKSLVDEYYKPDPDYPARVNRIMTYERVLDGTIYDVLRFNFGQEKGGSNEYIPIIKRRPSIRYNVSRLVVSDSSSLLFGEGHWPTIDSPDAATREQLKAFCKETNLNALMLDAAMKGACGSVAIVMQIIARRVYFTALSTKFLTPEWDPLRPDRLKRVIRRYKVSVADLKVYGYTFPVNTADTEEYWFRVDYSDVGEIWYLPQSKKDFRDGVSPTPDQARSTRHGLKFCPVVWIKNLPGGDDIDGACTFAGAIDTQMELEYQLSQGGRGLKYSSDPLLMVKEPPAIDDGAPINRSASSVLSIDVTGDAKLLEISGTAIAAVIDYVRLLREMALETMRGSRSSPDRLTVAQSGRAIELLYQSLIWLADNLRSSYGEGGILALMKMVIAAQAAVPDGLLIDDTPVTALQAKGLSLKWPQWFEPTPHDRLEDMQAISTGRAAGTISRELAVKHMAPSYDNENIDQEVANIESDIAEQDKRDIAMAVATSAQKTGEE